MTDEFGNEPEYEYKTFKISEVAAAIKENGFEHIREEWYHYTYDGKLVGGCVIAQGAINLSVNASSEDELFQDGPRGLLEALDRFPNISKNYPLDDMCGTAIVSWNDKFTTDENDETFAYALPTYEDVIEMVYDILAPYMDEEITLPVVDYNPFNPVKIHA